MNQIKVLGIGKGGTKIISRITETITYTNAQLLHIAEEEIKNFIYVEDIDFVLGNVDTLIVTARLGGDGDELLLRFIEYTKEKDIKILVVVSLPHSFEGVEQRETANKTLEALKQIGVEDVYVLRLDDMSIIEFVAHHVANEYLACRIICHLQQLGADVVFK